MNDDWFQRAACKGKPTEWWFPKSGEPTAYARRLCKECPVAHRCLTYALDNDIAHGTWGGMPEGERVGMRTPVARATEDSTGTFAAPRRPLAPRSILFADKEGNRILTHGLSAYKRGCRCEECTEAKRLEYHKKRGRQPAPPPKKMLGCGTRAAYLRGCRCEPCKRAASIYRRAQREQAKAG